MKWTALRHFVFSLKPHCNIIVAFSLLCAAEAYSETRVFKKYSDQRAALLERIASSKQRIILSTSYLTDGDVASALYLAKYRKLNVQVRLGAKQQNGYMSRMSFLRQQQINVSVDSRRDDEQYPTRLVADEKIFFYGSDLNFMTAATSFAEVLGTPEDLKSFLSQFEGSSAAEVPSSEAKGHNDRSAAQRPTDAASGGNDVFRYDRQQRSSVNSDMPKQLPRTPLYLRRQQSGPSGPAHLYDERALNPATARSPLIRSPKSPESY
jgi:hypothetical protein